MRQKGERPEGLFYGWGSLVCSQTFLALRSDADTEVRRYGDLPRSLSVKTT
jgi:hypothetical protein